LIYINLLGFIKWLVQFLNLLNVLCIIKLIICYHGLVLSWLLLNFWINLFIFNHLRQLCLSLILSSIQSFAIIHWFLIINGLILGHIEQLGQGGFQLCEVLHIDLTIILCDIKRLKFFGYTSFLFVFLGLGITFDFLVFHVRFILNWIFGFILENFLLLVDIS